MKSSALISEFQKAKNDDSLVIIEGVQALKHAVRFNAEIYKIITCDADMLRDLINELAPDVSETVLQKAETIDEDTFRQRSSRPILTKTITLAKKRIYKIADIDASKPIVLLENPKDLDNVGAAVRVASAADAGAVITVGEIDIWHPLALRGGAGLQYATPVFSFSTFDLGSFDRPVASMDPTGSPIEKRTLERSTVFIFGTERHGITADTLKKSDLILKLSMKPGVSSMNLATSVAATLYSR